MIEELLISTEHTMGGTLVFEEYPHEELGELVPFFNIINNVKYFSGLRIISPSNKCLLLQCIDYSGIGGGILKED